MASMDFEFDIAFSFGWKDEAFANRLHDLLQGRLTSFLYSKQQEMLAGTDGEQRFNDLIRNMLQLAHSMS